MKKPWLSVLIAGVFMAELSDALVWAHSMFVTGLNPFMGSIFVLLLLLLTVPLVIWMVRKLQWPVWMLFAAGAVAWLVLDFSRQVFLGNSTLDIQLHDTYYVFSHSSHMALISLCMAGFAGAYYWLGKKGYVNNTPGCIHFWGTFIGLYLLFAPQHYEGLAGMPRRYIDLSGSYSFNNFMGYNRIMSWSAMLVIGAQLVFVGMLVRKLFLMAAMLLIVVTASAQKNYAPTIDSFMDAAVQFSHFNGNVLVARSGKVIYQRSFGYSNLDTKQPLDENSLFELASVSKQFTAVGILLLVEEGKISLSDTLRKFFPELPYSNVTIRHLLTHTSGVPDYMDAMAAKWDHKKIAFNRDVIEFLAVERVPADFRPGERTVYSNTAYEMLASIIERVSGEPYEVYMMEHVFKPAGLAHTRVYNTRRSGEQVANYAYGYVYSDSLKKYVLPDSLRDYDMVFYLDGIVGDGTVNSTAGDLLKWDRALKEHKLLSAATQQEMFKPQSIFDTALKFYYGYGEFLGSNELGPYIAHSGGWPGYHTNLTRYPALDLTLIMLSNNESNVEGITGALAYMATDRKVVRPYEHKAIAMDGAALDKFVGRYSIPRAGEISIVRKGDKLYREKTGMPEVEVVPESSSKLFYGNGTDTQLEFEWGGDGKLRKVYIVSSGMKTEMTKK